MSLSTERERVIESLRKGIGSTAEYVDPSEFVVIRAAGGTLHFFAFKDDGSYSSVAVTPDVSDFVTGDGTAKITVSDTEPATPAEGDLWVDTSV